MDTFVAGRIAEVVWTWSMAHAARQHTIISSGDVHNASYLTVIGNSLSVYSALCLCRYQYYILGLYPSGMGQDYGYGRVHRYSCLFVIRPAFRKAFLCLRSLSYLYNCFASS